MAREPTSRRARLRRRMVGLRVRGRIYRAVLKPDPKIGGYTVRVPALPGCFTEGDTLAEAKGMAKEAIELWVSVAELEGGRSGALREAKVSHGRPSPSTWRG